MILRLYLKTCRTCVLLTRLEFPLPDKQSIKVTYSLIAIGEFHAPSENEKTENWGLRCRLLSPFRAHLALCKKNNQKTTEPGACNASLRPSRFLDVTQGSPLSGEHCVTSKLLQSRLRSNKTSPLFNLVYPEPTVVLFSCFLILRSSFLYPASRGFSLLFSRMAFSVYEVVRVACQSRSSFKRENDFVNTKSHVREELLLAGYPSSFSGSSFSTLPRFT